MATAISSVISFLKAKVAKGAHNGPDLLERFLKYECDMEVQVNVMAGEGEPVPGKRSTYTDGVNNWFSYRIPRNADTNPEFKDYKIEFPLDLHCEGIGSTGWDWVAKRSRWVGFDFDSIVGHATGVGVTKEELDKVRDAARNLGYVEARRSTGGAGLHLYVMFEDDPAFDTKNHTEHAALGRYILGLMSRDAGYNFQNQLDVCGGNLWIWHRKSSKVNDGLKLLKPATGLFPSDKMDQSWKDHIAVIQGKQARVRMPDTLVSEQDQDPFEQLTSAHRRVKLDEKHNLILDEIRRMGIICNWCPDHYLLQTHTHAFARLMGRKEELNLEGVFQTSSQGKDLKTANCFAFPLDFGGWKIFRFGPGTGESPTWEQDGKGWTTCGFNVRPSFKAAARALGGKQLKRGGYEFESIEKAIEVAGYLNPDVKVNVEDTLQGRKAILTKTKEGNISLEIPKGKTDPESIGEWNSSDKKGAWTQVLNIVADSDEVDITDYDELIRCLETTAGDAAGWSVKKRSDNQWTRKNSASVKNILQEMGHQKPEAEQIMGRYELRPWRMVMIPFTGEYPGNRLWNAGAPQLKYEPAPRLSVGADGEGENSLHPFWDLIMDHCGQDLTPYLKELEWAKISGIRTGGDYLKAICSSIIRLPYEPTPYLFFFGPENSGKSIFHEAFTELVTTGVVMADRALTNQSDFNGELEGAIICVVEEKDISKTPGALNKIKAAVTNRRLSIRKMRTNSYMVDNMTHWVQNANSPDNCPIFEGDTRITMMYVPRPKTDIPKTVLIDKLKEEAPQFMRTLMDFQLPPSTGRLRIPIVSTQHKQRAEQLNRSPLDQFITENLFECPGELVSYADFYAKFLEWLPSEEKGNWSRYKVTKHLPMKFASGAGNGNKTYLVNCSWEDRAVASDPTPYYVAGGRIKRVEK